MVQRTELARVMRKQQVVDSFTIPDATAKLFFSYYTVITVEMQCLSI